MKRTEKESAVSPVVGVMLMLVVTIIIAAVVAAFAGGLAGSAEKAPNAVLDVHIYSAANVGGTMSKTFAPDLTIDHVSGDPLNTADLKMTFTWKNSTGTAFKAAYTGAETNVTYVGGSGEATTDKALYVNDMDLGSPVWGKAVLTTGTHMQTYANYLGQDYIPAWGGTYTLTTHTGSPFLDVIFAGAEPTTSLSTGTTGASVTYYEHGIADDLPKGTPVHVIIMHTPSNKAVFDKEVIVQ